MTVWSYLLVWLSCLFLGEIGLHCTTATWVSLEGCYLNVSGSATHYIPSNGPRHCFGACKSTTSIGLQGNTCLCDALWNAWLHEPKCSYLCTEEGNMPCGSGQAFSVFKNVTREPARASGNLAYVYVKVSSDGDHTFTYDVTNNDSDQHLYICHFATFYSCTYMVSMESWMGARLDCQSRGEVLLPETYIVNNSCSPRDLNDLSRIQGKYFWIGLFWIMPILESTTTVPETTTTTTATTITTGIITYTATKTKQSAPSNYPSTTTLNGTELSSSGVQKKSNNLTVVLASVAAAFVVILVLIVGILWWKKPLRCCINEIEDQKCIDTTIPRLDLQHNLEEPYERNITTASGVRVDMYDQDAQRKRKKKKKSSKHVPDSGKYDIPPGISNKRSRNKHKKSRVLHDVGMYDVPADK